MLLLREKWGKEWSGPPLPKRRAEPSQAEWDWAEAHLQKLVSP